MADARKTLEILLRGNDDTGHAWRSAKAGGRSFADQTVGHLGRVSGAVLNLRNMIAGGMVAGAFKLLTDRGDEADKLSQRIGVTAQEFQVLSHAMTLGGGSASEVQMAFKSLTKRVLDADRGLAESARTFESLGISMDDLRGKSPLEMFRLTFQALGRIDDAATRSALAQELYGRSGLSLLPVLNQTGGSLDALAAKMRRNGQLLSDEQIAKSAEFKDALADLNTALTAGAFDALEEAIGAVSDGINDLVDSGKLAEWGGEAGDAVTELVDRARSLISGDSRMMSLNISRKDASLISWTCSLAARRAASDASKLGRPITFS